VDVPATKLALCFVVLRKFGVRFQDRT